MIESLLAGFKIALQPEMFLVTVLAVLRGLVVGSLLGLTATMAVAVLLPLTFEMPPQEGLIILVTIFIAAVQGRVDPGGAHQYARDARGHRHNLRRISPGQEKDWRARPSALP